MSKFSIKNIFMFFSFLIILATCKQKDPRAEESTIQVRTPVTVTSLNSAPIEEFIELNATSVYLQKSYVTSNLSGYANHVLICENFFLFVKGQVKFRKVSIALPVRYTVVD